jgi:AP-1-like transcription factor
VSGTHGGAPRGGSQPVRQDDENMKTGPMKYTPTDFLATFKVHHDEHHEAAHMLVDDTASNDNPTSSPAVINHYLPAPLISSKGSFTPSAHRISISPRTGNRLLSSAATWDFIQAHPLFIKGVVDIADVTQRLKGSSDCDGTGPAFEEDTVRRVIEESAAMGKDELI